MAANCPENLEPHKWKKGQSGNPKGRPKKLPELADLMALVLAEEQKGVSIAEAILNVVKSKAMKGDIESAKFLFNYAYGKPTQRVENVEGSAVTVRIIRENGSDRQAQRPASGPAESAGSSEEV